MPLFLPRRWIFASLGLAAYLWVGQALADSPEGSRLYVNSLSDFLIHTRTHILRVIRLGNYLCDHHPDACSVTLENGKKVKIDRKWITQYLALHDFAKVSGPQPYANKIYQGYNVDFSRASRDFRNQYLSLVEELNQEEKRLALSFFKNHGLLDKNNKPNAIAQRLISLERVADLVDRYLNPVSSEEFNKPMKAATLFLSQPLENELAHFFEKNDGAQYALATRGLSFEEHKAPRRGSASACLGSSLTRLTADLLLN